MICNIIPTESAIDNRDNVISLFEMYYDIFFMIKEKGRQSEHTHILILLKCMHTFLELNVSLSLVMLMLLNRMPSQLCFHINIKFYLKSLIS